MVLFKLTNENYFNADALSNVVVGLTVTNVNVAC